jgi:hypothetical protein
VVTFNVHAQVEHLVGEDRIWQLSQEVLATGNKQGEASDQRGRKGKKGGQTKARIALQVVTRVSIYLQKIAA